MTIPEGRLPRESNPTPGLAAGVLGSHKDRSTSQMHPTTGKDGGMDVNVISATADAHLEDIKDEIESLEGKDFATETTLAAVLAKMLAAPSTEAKQDAANVLLASLAGEDFATQTTLAAVLTKLESLETKIEAIKTTDGIKKITDTVNAQLTGSNAQGLVPQLMDFKGKVAGQTFDVPHRAFTRIHTAFATDLSLFSNEITGTLYGQIASLDGTSLMVQTTVASNFPQQMFSFDILNDLKNRGLIPRHWTVTELKTAGKQWRIEWTGYGVGASGGVSTNGATLKVWTGAQWVDVNTNTASSPTVIARNGTNITGSPWNYIDNNGMLHFLAHPTYASDGTIASAIYTDYIKLDVQFVGDYVLTDTARAYDHERKALRVTGDVTLSGSNVLIASASNVVVGAGANVTPIAATTDISTFTTIGVGASASAAHNWAIRLSQNREAAGGAGTTTVRVTDVTSTASLTGFVDRQFTVASRASVRITNNDTVDRTYAVELRGGR